MIEARKFLNLMRETTIEMIEEGDPRPLFMLGLYGNLQACDEFLQALDQAEEQIRNTR